MFAHLAVADIEQAAATPRQCGIVGDEQQGGAFARLQVKEQVDDGLARLLVEISCRLIGQQHAGTRGECAGDGHTLLFSAGKLARIVGEAVAKANAFEARLRSRCCIGRTLELEWNGDILEGVECGDQVKGLEDDANGIAPETRERFLALVVKSDAVDADMAVRDGFKSGDHHQERCLAGARWTDNADGLARFGGEGDILQNVYRASAGRQNQVNVIKGENSHN